MQQSWPVLSEEMVDDATATEMDWVIRLITGIRSVRSEMNVPGGAKIPAMIDGMDDRSRGWLSIHENLVIRLARLQAIDVSGDAPKGAVQLVHDSATVYLLLADIIDLAAEQARLNKEIAKSEAEIQKLSNKLGNEQFLAKAPDAVVEEQRERLASEEMLKGKLSLALERLASAL